MRRRSKERSSALRAHGLNNTSQLAKTTLRANAPGNFIKLLLHALIKLLHINYAKSCAHTDWTACTHTHTHTQHTGYTHVTYTRVRNELVKRAVWLQLRRSKKSKVKRRGKGDKKSVE